VPGVDRRIRVRHLLCHNSGLPAHRDFHQHIHSAAELIAAAAAEPPERPPGTAVVYSDLGFILLGGIVEVVSGRSLPRFAAAEVFAPLGMNATYTPPESWLPRIAATELMAGRPVHGRVHDENAAAAGGGVGHAGVFASLEDLERAIALWLPGETLLDEHLRAAALRDHTPELDGHRGFGWTCRGDGYDILSDGWGPAAVSHTGFTGTSMALDPVTGRWAVVLTNAVHFGRGRPGVLAARRAFHAELAS
ncbi:MAG: beta-lactamase family protein, partial [Actinomycetota bacterium]|nr:beta-lactamase family protein [Actinomycetota bacterium]